MIQFMIFLEGNFHRGGFRRGIEKPHEVTAWLNRFRMRELKTKSMEHIEERMARLDTGSLRHHVLECAKEFKSSWIKLGEALYRIWQEKLYKDWGYLTFDAYTAKEIGVRKQTALKLLRSYCFLQKEEPAYLRRYYSGAVDTARVPSYNSVNTLRIAKGKKEIGEHNFAALKEQVLVKGRDEREVRKDLTALIRQREEVAPEDAQRKKRIAAIQRLLGTLKSIKRDVEYFKLLPNPLIKDTERLIKKIEAELGQTGTIWPGRSI
jgi:hypothetical protein